MSAFCIATTGVSAQPHSLPTNRAVAPGVTADTASVPVPGLAVDTELCLAVSFSVEDAALCRPGARLPRSALITRLRVAEAQIGRHLDAADPRLAAALPAMRDAIAGLRHDVEADADIGTAIEVVLHRIDDLDAACQARLADRQSGNAFLILQL